MLYTMPKDREETQSDCFRLGEGMSGLQDRSDGIRPGTDSPQYLGPQAVALNGATAILSTLVGIHRHVKGIGYRGTGFLKKEPEAERNSHNPQYCDLHPQTSI